MKKHVILLLQSEEKPSQHKNCLVMVLHGSGNRKFEITKNLQWPWSFSEIDMKLIQNHLHWFGENFQKISCRYRSWFQRYSNFNNAQFLLFESVEWITKTIPSNFLAVTHMEVSVMSAILPVMGLCGRCGMHCQTSNISVTKSSNLNVSHLVLRLFLPNPLQPGVK